MIQLLIKYDLIPRGYNLARALQKRMRIRPGSWKSLIPKSPLYPGQE